MIFRDALRSMKKDKLRCFFYWLTFALTTMLIFLFENIAMSTPQPEVADFGMTLSVGVMLLVVIVCSLDIFFANSFYVKAKAKEMAVRLICGSTFWQIAWFLLLQTLLLLVTAVPAGILLSYLSMPLVSKALAALTGTYLRIVVYQDAVFISSVIILYIIFWTVLLNLSFAYKNAAGMLMNTGTLLNTNSGSIFKTGLVSDKAKGMIGLVLFFACALLFYAHPEAVVVFTVLGMSGLYEFNQKGMTSLLSKHMHREISSPLKLAADGLVRRDFLVLNQNIFLYVLCAAVLSSLLISHLDRPSDAGMVIVTYVLLTFLQSMTLMVRFASESAGREKLFRILGAEGYMKDEQKKIITREIIVAFGMILLASLFYSVNMMGSYMMHDHLKASLAVMLVLIQSLPFFLWMIIDRIYYARTVL